VQKSVFPVQVLHEVEQGIHLSGISSVYFSITLIKFGHMSTQSKLKYNGVELFGSQAVQL
jgi:hypothetical protein